MLCELELGGRVTVIDSWRGIIKDEGASLYSAGKSLPILRTLVASSLIG